jgi:hypothetical protein
MRSVLTRIGRTVRAFILALFASCLFLAVCPESAGAQDTTVFVDNFESLPVGTLSQGCGDMSVGQWRWASHHYYACYSAGWGVDYAAPMSANTTGADKALELWGGVPFGGGGDCAVTAWEPQFQSLTDYSIVVTVSPEMLVNGMDICKSGMVGLAGRVQDGSTFCSGYLLALVLTNGESLCGQGSLLQLYRNERGPNCNGSEAMSLLASQPVAITADLGGNFGADEEYVLKLCLSGSDIYGGVWSAGDWAGGEGTPIAEVDAVDDTYIAGTFGIYQGASRTSFDDVMVSVGGSCLVQEPAAMAADLDFDPNTLNTKSKGKYVTCYVELPDGLDPWDIDLSTMMLNDVIPAEVKPTNVGDHDEDGIDDRMMKFSRADLIDLLSGANNALYGQVDGIIPDGGGSSGGAEWSIGGTSGGGETGLGDVSWGLGTSGGAEFSTAGSSHVDTVDVWVSGLLVDGTAFSARDTIRVIGLDDGSGGSGGGSGGIADGGSGGSGGSGKGSGGGVVSAPVLTATPSLVKGKSKISFDLYLGGHVSLNVHDAAGRMVRRLFDEYAGPGAHYVTWDRTADDGRSVPPGVYFIKLGQLGNSSVQKLMVVK